MGNLVRTSAIAEIFPEGMRTTAFVLEYDEVIDGKSVSVETYTVRDHSLEPIIPVQERTVTKVYTNDIPEKTIQSKNGRFVIVETDVTEKASFAITGYKKDGTMNPYGPEPVGYKNPNEPERRPDSGKPMGGPPPDMGYTGPKPLNIEVVQNADIVTVSGNHVKASRESTPAGTAVEAVCKETERFQVCQYEDLPYNLFVPENYDSNKKYPLLLFIPDAGNRGTDVRTPLIQGIGAVYFSSPEDQRRHPCFIVSPNFTPDVLLTRDDFSFDEKMYKAKAILDEIIKKYNIDTDRIYTTGQSMGCMSSCQLMIRWPDFFAGAILVAGQWDPEACGRAMKDKHIWIFVSSNDKKAHPGMDAVTEAIKANGGKVAVSHWDAGLPVEEQNRCAMEALKEDANIYYTIFDGDTVVPEGQNKTPGANHTNTWRVAYQITVARDWLFTNRRKGI